MIRQYLILNLPHDSSASCGYTISVHSAVHFSWLWCLHVLDLLSPLPSSPLSLSPPLTLPPPLSLSLSLPLSLHRFSEQFHTVERTLCSVPPSPLSRWEDDEDEVIIDVFTSSKDQEHYTIEVNPVEDAVMRWVTWPGVDGHMTWGCNCCLQTWWNSSAWGVNILTSGTVQFSKCHFWSFSLYICILFLFFPQVRFFEFPSSAENVEVQAKSDDRGGCFIISVQKAAVSIILDMYVCEFVHMFSRCMHTVSDRPNTARWTGWRRSPVNAVTRHSASIGKLVVCVISAWLLNFVCTERSGGQRQ